MGALVSPPIGAGNEFWGKLAALIEIHDEKKLDEKM